MRTRTVFLSAIFSLFAGSACAQQNLVYNHYFINPFLYNPSFAAANGYTELSLNFRKQWSGISGAPTTGTLNLHVPLNERAGVAFSVYQDQAGLLETTGGLAAFRYQIFFGKRLTDVHKLSFGLSAGILNSRIDAENADDLQDPVLGNNTSSLDGQVGIHYQYNGLRIGIAIPRIFETRVASEESFSQNGIAQLNATISSLSYEFKLGSRVSIEPMVTYRTFSQLESQFEGLASVRLANVGWIGGAYRQNYGAVAFFGFNIREKLKVGYAYEFATELTDRIGNGTHEAQVTLRLGKKQFSRAPKVAQNTSAVTAPSTATSEPKNEPAKTVEPVEIVEESNENGTPAASPTPRSHSIDPVSAPSEETNDVQLAKQPIEKEPANEQEEEIKPIPQQVVTADGEALLPGHYVVVGAFQSLQNAKSYQRTLIKSGYPARVAFNPARAYYIVHMNQANTLDEARTLRDKYRQMSRYSFRDTWILSVE